jgi:hypothetical protein
VINHPFLIFGQTFAIRFGEMAKPPPPTPLANANACQK